MSWQIQINDNAPVGLPAPAFVDFKRNLRSQEAGTFTFRNAVQAMDSDPICGVNDLATIYWNETVFFRGRVTKIPRTGTPAAEDHQYEISDGWWDFEHVTMQQEWAYIHSLSEEGVPNLAYDYSSELNLGVDIDGNQLSIGQVIAEAVSFAIGCEGVPLCQIGTIAESAPINYVDGINTGGTICPIDAVKDVPVAEVIKKMMRWMPDAVAWFDYTTLIEGQPVPTFNVTHRAACTAVSVPFACAGDNVEVTPRTDLQVNEVVLRYVQPNTIDGTPCYEYIVDAAPGGADGLALGALVGTIRLQGGTEMYEKQPVKTIVMPDGSQTNGELVAFIQNRLAWTKQFDVSQLTATYTSTEVTPNAGATTTPNTDDDPDSYPNVLVSGAVTDWMETGSWQIISGRAIVYCTLEYLYPDDPDDYTDNDRLALEYFGPPGSPWPTWNGTRSFSIACTGTNASTQTYSQVSSFEGPEAAPMGLADLLYNGLNPLQYEGKWNVICKEVLATRALGTVLNITGSQQGDWGAMNALVQEISEDLDKGVATYTFGPAKHLTIEDLMEMLRAPRHTVKSSRVKEQQTGEPGVPGTDGPSVDKDASGGGDPIGPVTYPWMDFIDDQDDDDGNGATWDALIGYGQSSFAGEDGIDHSGPLEKLEISVGNDGSDWTGPDHDAESLYNGFSLICGDGTADNDQLLLGRTNSGGDGGSIILTPFDDAIGSGGPSLVLSPNLDGSIDSTDDTGDDQYARLSLDGPLLDLYDGGYNFIRADLSALAITIETGKGTGNEQYVTLDLSGDPIINISNATSGSYSSLDENSVNLFDGGSGTTLRMDASDIDDGNSYSLQAVTLCNPDGSDSTVTGYIFLPE